MVNSVVCNVLEVIFGIWIICLFVDFLFGIDAIEIIKKVIAKITNVKDNK